MHRLIKHSSRRHWKKGGGAEHAALTLKMLPRCHRPKSSSELRRIVASARTWKKGVGLHTRPHRELELLRHSRAPSRDWLSVGVGYVEVARSDHRIVLAVVVLFLTIILDDLDGLCARDDCLDAVVGPAIARQRWAPHRQHL